jgi:cob(I)alamin adenosyltransferase
MGTASSQEQSLKAAIERQDINAVKTIIRDSTSEQVSLLCNSLVPGNDQQCTMLHYAAWQGMIDVFHCTYSSNLVRRQ